MKITYPASVDAALKGTDILLIVAPKKSLARFPKVLPAKLAGLLPDLRKGLAPGDRGAVATTLTGTAPRRLELGCLPDTVSRYNCAARPEAVTHVVKASKVGSGKDTILFVLDDVAHALPAVNAMVRAFPLYSTKGKKSKKSAATLRVVALDTKGNVLKIDRVARTTAESTRAISRLVDHSPTEMNPEAMVREAKRLLAGIQGVRTSAIVGPDLLKKKLAGLHAVGRTAVKAPRLFVATYTPKGKPKQHIALVGKGITYDTGGLSLKGSTAMPTMKADMGGAAATLGAFRTLAQTGCKHKVTLVLCLAENAVGPTAYKPDDILTMHSGLTVEINNTDAEGRVVLADGVSYAARVLGCDTILDAATLTGAQLVATGTNHAAIFSNDARLEQLVTDAGYASGDLVHPLMFAPEFYKREFRSAVADMRNSVRNRANAQSSCAAQFIWWHLEDTKVKWCHVDLAGPAFPVDRATGFGCALLTDTVRRL